MEILLFSFILLLIGNWCLNNLEESILDVYKRGALKSLDNFNSEVINLVEPFIKNAKDLTKKRGLERFL